LFLSTIPRCLASPPLGWVNEIMNTNVFILVEGYVKDGGETVQSTVTLIQDGETNLIVDPGMTKDPFAIVNALTEHKLTPDDISFVIITHHHPDHTRHMGLFPKATLIDYSAKYEQDKWYDLPTGDYQITPHVKTMRTPGHTKEDITVLVSEVHTIEPNKLVTVGICHLWWYEGKEDDPTAQDMIALRESRKKVLGLIDYLIPGHGNFFKVA